MMKISQIRPRFVTLLVLSPLCATLIACSGGGGSSGLTPAPTVTTAVGQIQGLVRTYAAPPASGSDISNASSTSYSVYEYRGIPYALSPTGDRRWALPEPVTTLGAGVFKAYNFGPACPQQARFNLTEASSNEDCLSLNVSMPAGTKAGDRLPVFIWIHGGAFIGGSSSLYRLDQLAAHGKMVIVSMNYRLGALGFMPNPAFQITNALGTFNGNYGLEDQRLAMKWVQENIGAFGGDASNVTIAGESAGAASVCMHLTAPTQVNGLFHKAIVQSAGCLSTLPTVSDAQAPGLASASIQTALNCPTNSSTLACMQSKTVDEILTQQAAYSAANPLDIAPFRPVTGDPALNLVNTTIPSSFEYAAINNRLVEVPMIMGGTKEEMGLYVGYYWQGAQAGLNPQINSSTIDSFWLPAFYPGKSPSTIIGQYPDLNSGNSDVVAKAFGQVLSDYNPEIGLNNCLYLQTSSVLKNYFARNSSSPIPIYQFEFDDPAAPVCGVGIAEPCPPWNMGSVHSSELNYFFPNLSNTSAINAPNLNPASQGLANQMVRYWANFAYTGNPNGNNLPNWPVYAGANTASVMLLAPGNLTVFNADQAHQCTSFWQTLYSNLAPF
jgi:para-nitrobenzyl esterase